MPPTLLPRKIAEPTACIALALALASSHPAGSPARRSHSTPAATQIRGPASTAPARAKSVYEISPVADGSIIAVAGLASLLPYSFSTNLITRRCPCDPNEVNPIDRDVIGNANDFLDAVSDVTIGAAVIAPVLLDWKDVGASRALVEDLVVYAEVLAVNGALVTLSKYAAQRPLPRVYADPSSALASEPGGFRSFYSGHVSTTVSALTAASMTYQLRHGDSPWPWIITGAVGASVMIERVAAGRHFYSDVVFGAIAGLGVGTLIPLLHARRGESGAGVQPIASANRVGLAWSWML